MSVHKCKGGEVSDLKIGWSGQVSQRCAVWAGLRSREKGEYCSVGEQRFFREELCAAGAVEGGAENASRAHRPKGPDSVRAAVIRATLVVTPNEKTWEPKASWWNPDGSRLPKRNTGPCAEGRKRWEWRERGQVHCCIQQVERHGWF